MHDQFMEMLKERDEDGSCIVGGLNYAGEAYDRLEAQADEIERLREALRGIAASQPSDSEQAFNFKMLARAALEEKNDGIR